MKRTLFPPYFTTLDAMIRALGGAFNAHLHIDRAGTYDETVRLLQGRVRDGANLTLAGKYLSGNGYYWVSGFRDDEPARWALVEQAAERADFLGILPERDDRTDYPDHIGYDTCCRRSLDLAARLGKDLHIHVDQANHPHETGGETVARLVQEMGLGRRPEDEPFVWLIHLISPSTYDEPRFRDLADRLAGLGIGSPMGTPDLMAEVFVLANALRIYDMGILARIAAGLPLLPEDRARLRIHLQEDAEAVARLMQRHAPPPPRT